MKQFTFAIFLFSLITSSSQAQRGWRLFSGMGVTGPVHVIHESRDGTLWAGGTGLSRNDGSGWQSVAVFTGWVRAIHESEDGTLWVGGKDGLWC